MTKSALTIDPTRYPLDDETFKRIENIFTHHSPSCDQLVRYRKLRDEAKALAFLIVSATPKSREQSLALTHLEETVLFANAAIARHERQQPNESEQAGGDPVDILDSFNPAFKRGEPEVGAKRERNVIPA